MNKKELFRKQQAFRKKTGRKPLLHGAATLSDVNQLLNCDVDKARVNSFEYLDNLACPIVVDLDEARDLVRTLANSFDKARLEALFNQTQRNLVQSIASPFGIGKVLSAYDKIGGNVTTIHNAQHKIYAREKDEYTRSDYTRSRNSIGNRFEGGGKNSVGSTFTKQQMDDGSCLVDGYTGRHELASDTSPDHVISNSEFHKNGGYMLSETEKADFATDTRNLVSTRRDINISMRDHDKMEWKDWKQDGREVANKEKYGVNEDLLSEKYEQAKVVAREHAPSTADKAIFYATNAAETGAIEGIKMGGQQAFGVLLVELFTGAFEEIRAAFSDGLEGRSLLEDIKIRLKRVALRVSEKWEHIAYGFGGGLISGFISNLVTTVCNAFLTTGKRVVRMIREGVFSLLKALKTILFPPQGLTLQEAAHEAIKLVASGGIVIAGVALEEIVEKLVMSVPILVPISGVLSVTIVGSICAISMSLVAYMIDKMDVFGAISVKSDVYVLETLNKRLEQTINECDQISNQIDEFLLPNQFRGQQT